MNQKHKQSTFHANVNVNLMEQNLSQINVGITINVDASVKNIYEKKIMFGILVHVLGKTKKYFASIMDNSMICVTKL